MMERKDYIMGFKTEEEVEEWFTIEKQRLETEFLNKINKDKDNIPEHREKYDAGMKRLIARYEAEYDKLLANRNITNKK